MRCSEFTTALLDWYGAEARDLPWRRRPEPYFVWLSEVMAQQTQLPRVVSYFERWTARWPDLASLAEASEDEVLKQWEGLGYYSRARNLLKAARLIRDDFGGNFPADVAAIRSLPGVGDYTAGAVASIAFGAAVPAIDANALRIGSRVLNLACAAGDPRLRREVEAWVRKVMPAGRPGDFNQALMELGGLVCTKRPVCDACPVRGHCAALRDGDVARRPLPAPPRKMIPLSVATGILLFKGRVLIQKRRPDDLWPGLWEFPGGCVEDGETPAGAVVREFREEVGLDIRAVGVLPVVRHSYTRYRVTLHGFHCEVVGGVRPRPVFNEAVAGRFVEPGQLADYAFPAGHRKLIAKVLDDGNLHY